MDVAGPWPEPSLGGARYVATFLDAATGYSYVEPIARKADVVHITKGVLTALANKANTKVKAVQTDNGSEYVNNNLTDFYIDNGIEHRRTCPYTPESNGAAERLNRTLADKVKPMLVAADLPAFLWAELFVTANHLRNVSPVAAKTKTPYELFLGRKPDVSSLRTIGATAYAHIPKEKRLKGDVPAVRGVLVGYAHDGYGYRVFEPDTNTIFVSRHVAFDESGIITKHKTAITAPPAPPAVETPDDKDDDKMLL